MSDNDEYEYGSDLTDDDDDEIKEVSFTLRRLGEAQTDAQNPRRR